MKVIKKGVIVNCSRNPNHLDVYDIVFDGEEIRLVSPFKEIEIIDDKERILKRATYLVLDFFFSFVYKNKRKPKIEEFIPVLAYELSVSLEEAWKIFEALNFAGVVLIDREYFYVLIP